MRNILQYILKILARIVLYRYKPEIVAVTGSVGKTSTKEAIYQVLEKFFRVRQNKRNYNNEIGVPLTIIGLETGGSSLIAWLKNFLLALRTILWRGDYPEILVLEMGIDKPGDMEYLMSFVPVDVAVITAIGEFPVHLEFFPEKGKLVQEKALLAKSLDGEGQAVLNYDDLSVRMIADELPRGLKIVQYGFEQGANLQISNFNFSISDLDKKNFGISFKLEYGGSIVPVQVRGATGKQHAFTLAAAAGVGLYFGLNLVEISGVFKEHRPLPGRTNLLKGIKQTWIIDDSYNASPLATLTSLEILDQFSEGKRRKIAVLGDMLELGGKTEEGHRQVGQKVKETADLLFTVGSRAIFIADQARKAGMKKENIFEFQTSKQAGLAVQKQLEPQDIILVKGSRSIHMEETTREIMAHPEKAGQLLVK